MEDEEHPDERLGVLKMIKRMIILKARKCEFKRR